MKITSNLIAGVVAAVFAVTTIQNVSALSPTNEQVVREAGVKTAQLLQTQKGAAILNAVVGTEMASVLAQYLGVTTFDPNNQIQRMTLLSKLQNDAGPVSFAIAKDILNLNEQTGNTVEVGAIKAKIADLKLASVSAVKNSSVPATSKNADAAQKAALAAQYVRKVESIAAGVDDKTKDAVAKLLASKLWDKSAGLHADLCLASDADFTDPAVFSMVSNALANMAVYVDSFSQTGNNAIVTQALTTFHSSLVEQGATSEGACRATMDAANGCGILNPAPACVVTDK